MKYIFDDMDILYMVFLKLNYKDIYNLRLVNKNSHEIYKFIYEKELDRQLVKPFINYTNEMCKIAKSLILTHERGFYYYKYLENVLNYYCDMLYNDNDVNKLIFENAVHFYENNEYMNKIRDKLVNYLYINDDNHYNIKNLKKFAKFKKIKNFSKMNKKELLNSLKKKNII